jgi:uncharacterized protein with HEPN domain
VSPRDWRLRVQDILDAIATIQGYTAGMEYAAFVRDRRTIVVHEYFGINQQILWDTTQTDLPPLVGRLEGLLNRTR